MNFHIQEFSCGVKGTSWFKHNTQFLQGEPKYSVNYNKAEGMAYLQGGSKETTLGLPKAKGTDIRNQSE